MKAKRKTTAETEELRAIVLEIVRSEPATTRIVARKLCEQTGVDISRARTVIYQMRDKMILSFARNKPIVIL